MMKRSSSISRLLLITLATSGLAVVGCSSDRDRGPTQVKPPRDAGVGVVPDTGVAIRDGGDTNQCGNGVCDANETNASCPADCTVVRDGGTPPRDGGMDVCGNGICESSETFVTCAADCPPPTQCSPGEEGCVCNSTWIEGDPAFLQDDCTAALLCVPWDTISGRQDLTGPLQSCVRPCVTDAECGAGRSCVDSFGFEDTTGIGRVCVDRVAAQDEYCGASKLIIPRVAGVTIQTGNQQVGCAGTAECGFGVIESTHPDEGVCLQFCGRATDPPCAAPTPYCNPNLFTETLPDGSTGNIGLCSVAQLSVGSWCRPTLANSPGLTQICDTSAATQGQVSCVGLGVTYGLCMELCNTTATPPTMPCQTVDQAAGALYCVDGLLTSGGGICMTPNCENFPDTCTGAGANGLGQFCVELTTDDGLCADRRGPPIAPGTVDSTGALIGMGGDCQATDMGFTECPESSTCLGAQTGGICVIGCAAADGNYCPNALQQLGQGTTNATCAAILQDTTIGLCGGD